LLAEFWKRLEKSALGHSFKCRHNCCWRSATNQPRKCIKYKS